MRPSSPPHLSSATSRCARYSQCRVSASLVVVDVKLPKSCLRQFPESLPRRVSLMGHHLRHGRRAEGMLQHLLEGRSVSRVTLEQLRDEIESIFREPLPAGVSELKVSAVDDTQQLLLLYACFEWEATTEHHMQAHPQSPHVRLSAIWRGRLRQTRWRALVPIPDCHLRRCVLRRAMQASERSDLLTNRHARCAMQVCNAHLIP
mmetsp:Transcript_62016/g.122577  ORF Transcript_62016/g.122577 Transcript_62016/m.122577 type:complete len:204 (+) Transcript_62016:361-972(+)